MRKLRAAIGRRFLSFLFTQLRRRGFEPVKAAHVASAVAAADGLNTYIQISGALHNLFDRNPKAFGRIERYTDHIVRALYHGLGAKEGQVVVVQEITTSMKLAHALAEVDHLRARVVDLEKQLEPQESNLRAAVPVRETEQLVN